MKQAPLLFVLAFAFYAAPVLVFGQSPVAPPAAKALAPPSVFERYQKFAPDEPLTDWRKANDTVREIGGWRVYLKESMRANEAREMATAAATAAATATATAAKAEVKK